MKAGVCKIEYRQTPVDPPIEMLSKVQISGVEIKRAQVLGDDRGQITELIDVRDAYWNLGFKYLYKGTCRPGKWKGWGVHDSHEDRYLIISGEMLLVLFDDRSGSDTKGVIQEFYLSDTGVNQIKIPAGVWHLHKNLGQSDLIFLNSPSEPYSHKHPDKRRLPAVNDYIPYKFKPEIGW